jgi:putative PIN family toxin of toxin-antitoxin system
VKAVIDTNVLVSGLLKQGTPPAEVIADVLARGLVVLYDQRIIDEYRDVLARPKFGIDPGKAEALVEAIVAEGVDVHDAHFAGQLPDPDDQPFADVAFSGGADMLITGNTKHFPVGRAIRVVTPRDWLDIKNSIRLLRELGEDERVALEPNESFVVAMACKRCGTIRTEEILGLSPLVQPKLLPFQCGAPNPEQPDGRCGGELWTYDDNDLGRRVAAALGIPTRSRQ